MKTTQIEMLLVTLFSVLFFGCNPSKLTSKYHLSASADISKAQPENPQINVEEQIALYNKALEYFDKPHSVVTVQKAELTNWTYLGHRINYATTDGRGTASHILSKTQTSLEFSEVRQDACPPGMLCTLVYKPYVVASLSSPCQKASYQMNEQVLVNNDHQIEYNFSWTVVSGEKKPSCNSADERLFSEFSMSVPQNYSLVTTSGNFLFIQFSGIVFIFSK